MRKAGISARAATRLVWTLWGVCVALVSLALYLEFTTDDIVLVWSQQRLGPVLAVLTGVLSLAFPTVGALIVSRLPANLVGWIFCGVGLLYGMRRVTLAYADHALYENLALPGGAYMAWFSTWVGFAGPILAGVILMLVFPNGRLPSRRWRIVAWAAVLGAALTVLADAFMPGPLSTHHYVENPLGWAAAIGRWFTTYDLFATSTVLGTILLLASSIAALFSLLLRLRHTRGNERQQLKWFLFAAAPATVCLDLILLDPHRRPPVATNVTEFPFSAVGIVPWDVFNYVLYVAVFALLVVPICTYIAILRYDLYDIDLLINRTLVYGTLSACVVGIYVLAVGGFGVLFQARGNLGVSLLATGLVAVLFQPLRSALQRGVNRLMYGERDDPYAVLSRLGRRLEATIVPERVLPTVVETIAEALKLPYAAILLKEEEGYRSAAAYGSPTGEPEVLPLVYQREEIGRLVIAPRAPGEGFSAADSSLLEDLARQAEVTVHAVRLTTDLQRSRERLVATREEERRRLRRDLHDGFGPTLASLALGLNVARKLMAKEKLRDADGVLDRLEQETEETVADVRRLIYGLRPPALDDLGLVASIRQQAESQGFALESEDTGHMAAREDGSILFSLDVPEELPLLPAAVEVATYRIAQEALTNVARHARARTCRVHLSVDRASATLACEVTDDGVGIPEGRRAGIGLASLRERAEELGGSCDVESVPEGGTRVLARLPLEASGVRHQASGKDGEREAVWLEEMDQDADTTGAMFNSNLKPDA